MHDPASSPPQLSCSTIQGLKVAPTGKQDCRVLMFSQRGLDGLLSRCVSYEFEDAICEMDDVELVTPALPSWFRWRNRAANQLAKRLPWTCNPGLERIPIEKDYDLFLAVVEFPMDLSALQAMPDWRCRSRRAICWIEELWPGQLTNFRGYARILSQFDHVILNCNYSVDPLRKVVATDCRYLPPGVDAIRFCPYPDPAPRSIYVHSLGRRAPTTHEALLRHCGRERLWYMHDTVNIDQPKQTDDPVAHRLSSPIPSNVADILSPIPPRLTKRVAQRAGPRWDSGFSRVRLRVR